MAGKISEKTGEGRKVRGGEIEKQRGEREGKEGFCTLRQTGISVPMPQYSDTLRQRDIHITIQSLRKCTVSY